MTTDRERIFSRPDCLNNFQAGILAMRVNANQASPRPQCPRQGRNDAFGAKIDRRFGTVGLGSDDEVEIGLTSSGARDDLVEQEPVFFPLTNHGDPPPVYPTPATRTDIDPPLLLP